MSKARVKIVEWTRRYLPLELAGWVGELLGAAVAYWWTGSLAAAAIVATIGSSVGYYAPAYVTAVRWAYRDEEVQSPPRRTIAANLLAVRSLTVEFGIGEAVDSLLVRPSLIYLTPLLLDHVVWGWILGGFVADIIFYVFTICSYENFGRWVLRRPTSAAPAEPAFSALCTSSQGGE